MNNGITIALSKGRIFKETLPLLEAAGIVPKDDPEKSRKLILDTNHDDVKLVIIRATDVPTYVQYGAADLGVAGKDVLLEHGGDGLYELVDLNIAKCKLMTAGKNDFAMEDFLRGGGRLRIATKFVNVARQYFAEQGQQVEVIKLYGSMELGPIVGLSDLIVDVVDTGNTLKANGLKPIDHIADVSSRLVVNKASLKIKHDRIQTMVNQLRGAVK
jgi:ATP phosphoribosyltransferase